MDSQFPRELGMQFQSTGFWWPLSRCTQIADLTGVWQFPTVKSQTEPLQIGVKSRTVCAAPPPALLTMAVALPAIWRKVLGVSWRESALRFKS
jgi:hypothetical protein